MSAAAHYDEFGLFHENARGVRHRLATDRRTCGASQSRSAPATRSARSCGVRSRRSSSCSTVARRTRTRGTPSRSRSTVRWLRSTFPVTATRRTATITCTGRADNAVAVETGGARARAGCRAASSGCRSAGSPRSRSPIARPSSCAQLRARRRHARRQPREVDGDRAVHRRTRILRDRSTRSSSARSQFNPTRSESSLRRGILHNAIETPDGRWRWRYDLPRRGPAKAKTVEIMPGLDDLWDAVSRVRMPLTAGARQHLARRRRRGRGRAAAPLPHRRGRGGRRRRAQRAGRQAAWSSPHRSPTALR